MPIISSIIELSYTVLLSILSIVVGLTFTGSVGVNSIFVLVSRDSSVWWNQKPCAKNLLQNGEERGRKSEWCASKSSWNKTRTGHHKSHSCDFYYYQCWEWLIQSVLVVSNYSVTIQPLVAKDPIQLFSLLEQNLNWPPQFKHWWLLQLPVLRATVSVSIGRQ